MKNFNIFGVQGKVQVLGGREGSQKKQYIRGLLKNLGLGHFLDLRGEGQCTLWVESRENGFDAQSVLFICFFTTFA